MIPGYSVIFTGKARDPHPLRNFFPYTFTKNSCKRSRFTVGVWFIIENL